MRVENAIRKYRVQSVYILKCSVEQSVESDWCLQTLTSVQSTRTCALTASASTTLVDIVVNVTWALLALTENAPVSVRHPSIFHISSIQQRWKPVGSTGAGCRSGWVTDRVRFILADRSVTGWSEPFVIMQQNKIKDSNMPKECLNERAEMYTQIHLWTLSHV